MDPINNLEGKLIFGIDLGTTKSGIAVWDPTEQGVQMLRNAEGEAITRSVVGWDRGRLEWTVGKGAQELALLDPAHVVYSIKRFIGRWYADRKVQTALAELTYRLVSGGGEDQLRDVLVDFGTDRNDPDPHLVSAPEISAKVLEKLRRDAARHLELPLAEVRYAVITVPAYFDVLQRQATRLAGELAGLEVVAILNEPTAAALAYGAAYGNDVIGPDIRKILVWDLGGGTFDISILETRRFDVGYEVFTLGVDGDTRLGGDDIDAALVHWIADEIQRIYGRTVRQNDDYSRTRLRLEAERAKVALSSESAVTLHIPNIDPDGAEAFDAKIQITRDQLEACAADVLQRTSAITKDAVERVEGLRWEEIDQVILVGGQTLMPAIQHSVEELTGQRPRVLDWPQQAVARGAGEYARICSLGREQFHDYLLSHVIALPLGIRVDSNTFKPLVSANRVVPHLTEPLTVTTTEDGQREIVVEVLQQPREAKMADDCVLLGSIEMQIPPAPARTLNFEVQFDVHDDGTMKVLVTDRQRKRVEELDVTEAKTVTWRYHPKQKDTQ